MCLFDDIRTSKPYWCTPLKIGLKLLVTMLLDVIPLLRDVFILACLFIFMFALLGVSLWKGAFRSGCYDNNGTLFEPKDGFGYVCSDLGWYDSISPFSKLRFSNDRNSALSS